MKSARLLLIVLPHIVGTATLAGAPTETASSGNQSAVMLDNDTLTVDFPDADIGAIIKNVGELFHLDLRLPPQGLPGKTSIKLRDVTWRQIFKVTLVPAGFDFYERDGAIIILDAAEVAALPPVSETIALKHQTPESVVAYLRRFDPGLGVQTTETRDGIVLEAHPQKMPKLRSAIANIDSPDVSLDKFTRTVFLPSELPETFSPPQARL